MQVETSAGESEIDRLVYALYELTPEEIASCPKIHAPPSNVHQQKLHEDVKLARELNKRK